jgi:D-glycero-D-manno-heptose 1,7-bisphosphate phosphatase
MAFPSPRLVLLDRDGVLNEDSDAYIKSPAELHVFAGAPAAVARLNRAAIKVAVVSNQSVVGRGTITLAALDAIHAALTERLAAGGAMIDALLFAPDHPDRPSERRKPGPGMLVEAMARFGIVPTESVMVGDQPTDIEAARRAGVPFILVRTGKGRATEAKLASDARAAGAVRAVVDDVAAAVDLLLGAARAKGP